MSDILITGGAGFIGSHLAEALVKRGRRVRILDNFSTGNKHNLSHIAGDLDVIRGDIRDLETVKKAAHDVRCIYHLAAISSVLISVDDPISTWEANVSGTWNVLEAARLNKVKRLVFASSASVYGDRTRVPFAERIKLKGSSPYATSKLLGEQFCDLYLRLYGIESVSLRFFSVYGPRQNPKSQYSAVIPTFATLLLKGATPTIFGSGKQTRDFIYIGDIVRAIIMAGQKKKAVGEVFNVGMGQQTSVNGLLAAIQTVLKTNITPKFAPLKPGDDPKTCADMTKTRVVLNFSPQMTLEKGLAKTVNWFKEKYG